MSPPAVLAPPDPRPAPYAAPTTAPTHHAPPAADFNTNAEPTPDLTVDHVPSPEGQRPWLLLLGVLVSTIVLGVAVGLMLVSN